MVIGNGMIANKFMVRYKNDSQIIIFAAGVSNSNETSEDQYIREKSLLQTFITQNPNSKFVYFSSVIHLSGMKTRYLDHKREIETLIQSISNNYLIIRLPQVVGFGGNKNNIVNYFDHCVKHDIPIKIQKETIRSVVDIDDVVKIVDRCIVTSNNTCLNLSYIERISAEEIANIIYVINDKPTNILYQPKGYSILSENSLVINKIIKQMNINPYNYTRTVLTKYITV